MTDFDVAVIGGGPAGAFSAYLLASEGFNVCLFEKKSFPRETLCGEFLSYEVSNHLKDAGLFEKFLNLVPNKITSFRMYTPSGNNIHTDLKFTAFGLRRSTLDNFILNEAKAKGVTIFQPYSVSFIKQNKDHFIISADAVSEGKEVRVKSVINASGKKSSVDKILHRSFPHINSPFNGVKIHLNTKFLRSFNKNEIHIYTGKNLYCGVNKVEGEHVTICFLERRGVNDPSVKEKLISLKNENRAFGEILSKEAEEAIRTAKVYGTGGIYFGKKEAVKDGVYMVGDSAGMIAPLAGDGIGMAMESARLISEILIGQRSTKISDRETGENYASQWNKKFRRRIVTAGLIQKIMFTGILNPGLKLLNLYPRSINTLIDYTRK